MLSTVTSKGQITIPVEVRRAAGIEVGTQVEFIINTRKRIELVPRHHDIRSLRGAVKTPDTPVTLEAMDASVVDGWRNAAPARLTELAVQEPIATYLVKPLAPASKP